MVHGDHRPTAGDDLLGCRLDAPLGDAQASTVWRARQVAHARDVVVKVVPADEAEPRVVRGFAGTLRQLRRLAPAYAPEVLDGGVVDGRLVLVTHLAPGDPLAELVHREGPLAPARAVNLLAQLASGLDAIHRAGIVHGAVDARHVRVTGEGRAETAALVELGLRRRHEAARSEERIVAPEVREGEPPAVASDVYGLAGLLHLMVTGVRPGARLPFPPWRDDERGRLRAVAALGLATSPGDRPPGARALADAAAMALDLVPHDAMREFTHSGQPTEQPRVTREVLGDVAPTAVPRTSGTRGLRLPQPGSQAQRPERPRTPAAPAARSRRGSLAGLAVAAAGLAVIVASGVVWAVADLDGPGATGTQAAGATPGAPTSATAGASAPAGQPSTSSVEVVGGDDGLEWGTIRPGVIGPQVTAFEWLFYADGAGSVPDGVYDAPTTQMVSDYQVAAGLPVTGLVDPRTWRALAEPVAPGDQGPRVRALQQLLRVQQPLRVDGLYDARTADAVAAFQRQSGLTRSGEADEETWAALSRAWD